MITSPLKGKKILVAVTGGIAAYKACSLVTALLSTGAHVRVMMTDAATKFVGPQTFQALTNHAVCATLWDDTQPESIQHIALAHWPDAIVVYPATANTIAKMAHGFADNVVTTVLLAALRDTRIIVAPAMNTHMWLHPLTQANLGILLKDGRYSQVAPRSGVLACRDEGAGKVADVPSVVDHLVGLFS